MSDPLILAARHGRWVLVAGLLTGLAAPGLADAMRPALRPLVVLLLFLSFLRMDWTRLDAILPAIPATAGTVLVLQLAMPLAWIGAMRAAGLADTPAALAIALMLSAPSIAGAPNIAMMLGAAPDHALRLMIAGTALLPLNVLPVFALVPALDGGATVARTALLLVATIAVCSGAAWSVHRLWRHPGVTTRQRLDGASALVLAVFVVGLMPQVSRTALTDPMEIAGWAALAFGANLGLQAVTWRMGQPGPRDRTVPLSIIAGNRNIALFLVSLPSDTMAPLLAFIGCYQLPMYLTPILMARLYQPCSKGQATRR